MGESNGGTFAAAVAAAALAAMSSENDLYMKQRELTKERSTKKQDDGGGRFIRWLSSTKEDKLSGESSRITDKKTEGIAKEKVPSFKKTPTFSEEIREKASNRKTPTFSEEGRERGGSRKTPSFAEENREKSGKKKMLSFSEENRDRSGNKRFDQEKEQEIQPVAGWDKLGPGSTILNPQPGETKADAWEREKLQKIRERFEKMNATILEWENEKKAKAKRKLEQKEREIETRRLKAQAQYREEMTRIDKIAGDARTLAEERKINDEIKAIEKAKKMRSAGRSPKSSCPCF